MNNCMLSDCDNEVTVLTMYRVPDDRIAGPLRGYLCVEHADLYGPGSPVFIELRYPDGRVIRP
jgi:hypothetical protein